MPLFVSAISEPKICKNSGFVKTFLDLLATLNPISIVETILLLFYSVFLFFSFSFFFSFFSAKRLRIKSRNPPNCAILDSWVFDNFRLADELFAKALQTLEACLLVSYNFCGN